MACGTAQRSRPVFKDVDSRLTFVGFAFFLSDADFCRASTSKKTTDVKIQKITALQLSLLLGGIERIFE